MGKLCRIENPHFDIFICFLILPHFGSITTLPTSTTPWEIAIESWPNLKFEVLDGGGYGSAHLSMI